MQRLLPFPPPQGADALERERGELAAAIDRLTPTDGAHPTAIPGLSLVRYSSERAPQFTFYEPQFVLVAQGQKRVVLAGQTYEYGRTHGLITALDLPLLSQITLATPDAPYLCVRYALDLPHIAEVMADLPLPEPLAAPEGKAISCTLSSPLLDVTRRLVRLLDTPVDIPFLAPLIKRELLYRLLASEQGLRLRHLTMANSQSYKIGRAIEWLKVHYMEPLRVEELARRVAMSVSAMSHHFKAITGMSPLQYQKHLRLYEARRLLINQGVDATTAASTVGYSSLSQFSREYSRLFGVPPTRDVTRYRIRARRAVASS